jgi:hypothetical protein
LQSDGFRFSEDHFGFYLRNPPIFSHFDNLSVQQVLCWYEPRKWIAASRPFSFRLNPDPIGVQQGLIVFGELVAGKERNVLIGHIFDPIQK